MLNKLMIPLKKIGPTENLLPFQLSTIHQTRLAEKPRSIKYFILKLFWYDTYIPQVLSLEFIINTGIME